MPAYFPEAPARACRHLSGRLTVPEAYAMPPTIALSVPQLSFAVAAAPARSITTSDNLALACFARNDGSPAFIETTLEPIRF